MRMKSKSAGVLLHITSLPNHFGIGDFGLSAYKFVDSLNASGQSYWQILPLTITNTITGNSPYSSPSAFAINPILVSPEILEKEGLIKSSSIKDISDNEYSAVDYKSVTEYKETILREAYNTFLNEKILKNEFNDFCKEQNNWLDDYALFEVIRRQYNFKVWSQWPDELCNRKQMALDKIRKEHSQEYGFYQFSQFVFMPAMVSIKDICEPKEY